MTTRLPYLDSIKGLSIIFVLLLHSLSRASLGFICASFHIGQAVPIFLTVTFYLSYLTMDRMEGNVGRWYGRKRVAKMLKRVVLPFVVVLILQCIILIYLFDIQWIKLITEGGYGPGSYYIWVYLQIWLLSPFVYKLLKWRVLFGSLLVLGICVLLNIVCSEYCPGFIWRISGVRYLFLSIIAWIWYQWSNVFIKHKYLFTVLVIVSFLYLLFFSNQNLTPIIYNDWKDQNYPVYFWTLGLIILIVKLVDIIPVKLNKVLIYLGQNSWEIFLVQMFIIGFVKRTTLHIQNPTLAAVAYVIFCFVTSIGTVLIFKLIQNHFCNDLSIKHGEN